MKWPEAPTHHGPPHPNYPGDRQWRAPICVFEKEGWYSPRIVPWRECSFCGSIHPEDLVLLMERKLSDEALTVLGITAGDVVWTQTPRFELADQKYGYPHKFYIHELPTLFPERTFQCGQRSHYDDVNQVQVHTPIMSGSPGYRPNAKFYTSHFTDEGYDSEAWSKLQSLISSRTRIEFSVIGSSSLSWTYV